MIFRSVRRRAFLIATAVGVVAAALPTLADPAAPRKTLVNGVDPSDTITLDPARMSQYTPPMTLKAACETLVTMDPGDYINVKPQLATKWERTPDGKGYRFTLRDGVKFASGNLMTAEDVKFSLDRVLNLKD